MVTLRTLVASHLRDDLTLMGEIETTTNDAGGQHDSSIRTLGEGDGQHTTQRGEETHEHMLEQRLTQRMSRRALRRAASEGKDDGLDGDDDEPNTTDSRAAGAPPRPDSGKEEDQTAASVFDHPVVGTSGEKAELILMTVSRLPREFVFRCRFRC